LLVSTITNFVTDKRIYLDYFCKRSIGNASYQDNPLKNSINDAEAMANALKDVGFDVILLENADLKQIENAIDTFHHQLKAGGVGLFYYAGHGTQVDGENYLIPELPPYKHTSYG
jgi:uncharacterized caspase-like protein